MIVLGLSYGYHDSSVTLVKEGEVLFSSSEERFTKRKHDSNFPYESINEALKATDIKLSQIDKVVLHENPQKKFLRVLTSSFVQFPFTRKEFVRSMISWLSHKCWSVLEVSNFLNISPSKIAYLDHHFAHAAQAFLGSGFKESAILVVDAVGDWSCTTAYQAKWNDNGVSIEQLLDNEFPHSLGLIYSTFTAYLGFNPNSDECSVMALAAFGQPNYVKEVKKLILSDKKNTYRIDTKYFNFFQFYKKPYTKHFLKLFGDAPKKPFEYKVSSLKNDKTELSSDEQRFLDIACSIQVVFEEIVEELAKKTYSITNTKNLCYAGGGALNCVANSKLLNASPFEKVFIPIDPGDGGSSMGVALLYSVLNSKKKFYKISKHKPDLGSKMSSKSLLSLLDNLDLKRIKNYQRELKFPEFDKSKISYKVFESEDALIANVASLLFQKKIVGWIQGQAEVGPRALGYRSILVRPDCYEVALRLSIDVKSRAAFRPYALAMSEESAQKVLEESHQLFEHYRWMQYSASVKLSERRGVQAGIHIDNSTRPQICYKEDNPRFHKLLKSFGKNFGRDVLINTSFNESNYPIVNSEIDALMMFLRTGMNTLVINNILIEKV